MILSIQFFDQYRLLGGTEFEASFDNAVAFAHEGLARHDAAWARVVDETSGVEKRLCARALMMGHPLSDRLICRKDPLCEPCPVLATRWTTEADEDCGWCPVGDQASTGAP